MSDVNEAIDVVTDEGKAVAAVIVAELRNGHFHDKKRMSFASAVITLLIAVLGVGGYNAAINKPISTSDVIAIRDGTAVLASALSKHIEQAEETLTNHMDILEYMDLKQEVYREIDSIGKEIDEANEDVRDAQKNIDDLDLSQFRRESENTFTAELLNRYNTDRLNFVDIIITAENKIRGLEGEIRNEERKLR